MEQATLAGTNGSAPASARDRIAHDLEAEIAKLLRNERQLELDLAQIKAERKAFEQAIQRLRGEPLIKQTGRRAGRPKSSSTSDGARSGKVSPELLEAIRAGIMRFAADHDEFRQVDIRTMPDAPTEKSSATALAFEQLRQDGVIRFARKDGNNKFYRLTSESLRGLDA
jgi:hypothetical protein